MQYHMGTMQDIGAENHLSAGISATAGLEVKSQNIASPIRPEQKAAHSERATVCTVC